jgi:uncharacterized membrane protein YkvA (DUF1232 family)
MSKPMPGAGIDPQTLKKLFVALAIIYLVFPRDLIPDYLGGGLGLIDDAALIAFLVYYFRKYARGALAAESARENANSQGGQRPGQGDGPGGDRSSSGESAESDSSPYAVLGVSRGASQEEIRKAYRARMQEYHPDKVSHLGEDLQELALRRSQDIQRAYQRLRR